MSYGQTVFFCLAILGSSVIAQDDSNNSTEDDSPSHRPPHYHHHMNDNHHERAGFFPDFGQFLGGSNRSDPFSQIASAFGQFIPGFGGSNNSGFGSLISAFLPHSGRSQRVEFASGDLEAENGTENSSPHDRFFFSLFHHFGVPIGCNYTSQAGYSCAGCREQLLCNSNNVGRIRICPFYAPYCYNGVCGNYVNSTCTNSTG